MALAGLACQLSADVGLAGAGGRAEPWIVAAHARELAGDLYEAVGLLRRAVERDPGCAEAHLQAGRLAQRACGTPGAASLADFEAALRLRPSARAFREAVEAALGAQQLQVRGRRLHEGAACAQGRPGSDRCCGGLGQAVSAHILCPTPPALWAGPPPPLPLQAARRLARRALEAFPASLACRLLQPQVLARDPRRVGQAEAQLRRVLREEPRCEEAALLLAVLLAQRGRAREAAALLADQLAAAPSLAAHVVAGRLALDAGQLEDAASHFHAALGHNPFSHTAAKVGPCGRSCLLQSLRGGTAADLEPSFPSRPLRSPVVLRRGCKR